MDSKTTKKGMKNSNEMHKWEWKLKEKEERGACASHECLDPRRAVFIPDRVVCIRTS